MRRLISLVVVSLVMAAMLVAALPALAAPPPTTHGTFACYKYDPFTGQYTYVDRVPRGQVANYEIAGWECYRTYGG